MVKAELIEVREERLHREATAMFRATWPELAGFVTVDLPQGINGYLDDQRNFISREEGYE